jgi:hypothetical protein
METELRANILHTIATNDRCGVTDGNTGRILLADAKAALKDPNLTTEEIFTLWRAFYPKEYLEENCGVIQIYFKGKPERTHKKCLGTLVEGCSTVVFAADKSNLFKAEPPATYEPADFPATNPEDRIIL